MKTLLLLRHAKSSWDDPSLRDFDRPLAKRGRRDAPRMGRALAERGAVPELVISSPAARARETVEAVLEAAGLAMSPRFEPGLYAASSAELLRLIRGLPETVSCALLVAHNPGLEDLLSRLAGSPERMPTAALACLRFSAGSWGDVEDGDGERIWMVTPKQLPQG